MKPISLSRETISVRGADQQQLVDSQTATPLVVFSAPNKIPNPKPSGAPPSPAESHTPSPGLPSPASPREYLVRFFLFPSYPSLPRLPGAVPGLPGDTAQTRPGKLLCLVGPRIVTLADRWASRFPFSDIAPIPGAAKLHKPPPVASCLSPSSSDFLDKTNRLGPLLPPSCILRHFRAKHPFFHSFHQTTKRLAPRRRGTIPLLDSDY